MNVTWRRTPGQLAAMAVAAFCGSWLSIAAAPQASLDVEALLARVGERVADYYRRAQSVIGVERDTVQPIQWDWTAEGFARTVESELRVESGGLDGALRGPMLVRNVRRINGRAPRERDLTDRSGCTDPEEMSAEPLAFLLPIHSHDYRFTSAASGREGGRAAVIVDFRSANRTSRPELIEDPRGHADCFDWSGPVATKGRVWVDAETFQVLRVDRHNEGPLDVRVSSKLQRRYHLPPWIAIDRDDLTIRFRPITFSDPDEVIVLPASLVALTVVRSGLQSTRRSVTFSGYRRFLTRGRMIKDP
jgi:hypothetical protein